MSLKFSKSSFLQHRAILDHKIRQKLLTYRRDSPIRGRRIVFLVLFAHHALRTAKGSINKRIKRVADSYVGITGYVWTESESAKKVPSAIIFFLISCTSFLCLKTRSVKPGYDYCTLHLFQTAARHSEASFLVGRTNLTP